jgi:hypothetical protein
LFTPLSMELLFSLSSQNELEAGKASFWLHWLMAVVAKISCGSICPCWDP